ncbi:MAG: hypothetical protein Q9220_003228 [cf. Caloplaca sp. 1 TL-2023]
MEDLKERVVRKLGGRQISPRELQGAFDVLSKSVALHCSLVACNVHENCDESCTKAIRKVPAVESRFEELSQILAHPGPSNIIPWDIPHDRAWADQQRLSAFQYSTIDSLAGEVRVLKIHKAHFRSDIVECEIMTVALGQGTRFDALSYCCGSAGTNEVMFCNRKKYYLRPSLNSALKAYRESMPHASLLWADAVSINQEDKKELSEQIPLMRRIYTEAVRVSVYLGPAGPDFSRALTIMHKLYLLQLHQLYPETFGYVSISDIKLPPRGHESWTEYLKIFDSPWFTRTWIIQEIVLSARATLHMGRYSVDWEIFEHSYNFLTQQYLEKVIGMAVTPRLFRTFVHGITSLGCIQNVRRFAQSSDACSFIEVLKATQQFDVSNPSDKVIGILGLVSSPTDELRSLSDLTLTTAQVFHKASAYLIRSGYTMDTLEHADIERSTRSTAMPSWVANWYFDNRTTQQPFPSFRPPMLAAGGSESMLMYALEDVEYPSELRLLGSCNGVVKWLSDAPLIDNFDTLDRYLNLEADLVPQSWTLFSWHDSARACVENAAGLVYENVEEAFVRTLLVDDLHGNSEMLRSMTPIMELIPTYRSAVAQLERAWRSPDFDQACGRLLQGEKKDQVQSLMIQMIAAMRGRRFAVTDTGYMCLVPSSTRVGDAIAVILGCRLPFAIRLHPGQRREGTEPVRAGLIGNTYMHGAMAGELLPEWPPDVFVLT